MTGTDYPDSKAQRGSRLLITVCVLAAIGFCTAVLFLSGTNESESVGAPPNTSKQVSAPVAVSAARSSLVGSAAQAPNPAAQKAGLSDLATQRSAAAAAENAAKAAADLAAK
jgi:hypothetical protein